MTTLRLMCKLWLDYDGRAFGDGPARLLTGVEHAGSLRKAAQELGMSYNKAWRILHAAEERLGFALLDRSVGGSLGGGSHLTAEARELVTRYRTASVEVDQALETIFKKHFADWTSPAPAKTGPELRQVRSLDEDLAAARAYHGHLCHGMVMGVRMARAGCRALGIDDPLLYRDLIVYVEMDRCASDAVSVVCGVTLGKRRLKWVDYGKLAATFYDLATESAVRVAPRLEVPHVGSDVDPITFWADWSDDQLFTCTPVQLNVPEEDRPGRPVRRTVCEQCGEQVQDAREVVQDGQTLCRACANGAYYRA